MYLTRNQAYRKVSGVRIPPSPPKFERKALIFQGFLFFWWAGEHGCDAAGGAWWTVLGSNQ
jgi:hypothetical protein